MANPKQGLLLAGVAVAGLLAVGVLVLRDSGGESALAPELQPEEPVGPAAPITLEPASAHPEDGGSSARAAVEETRQGSQAATVAAPRVASGRVVDLDGDPIEGVLCETTPGPSLQTETAADGSFAIEWPQADAPEGLSLTLLHPSYQEATFEIRPGDRLELALRALPVVTGLVTDPAGRAPGAPAQVVLQIWEGDPSEVTEVEATTDAGGSFRIEGLPLGTLAGARARAKGYAKGEVELSQRLEVEGEVRLDLSLREGAVVAGYVVEAETREPIAGALVWADEYFYTEDGVFPETHSASDGSFRLEGVNDLERQGESGFEMAFLWVQASAEGYASDPGRVHAQVVREDREYEVVVELVRAGASLGGQVTYHHDGSPAAASTIALIDGSGRFLMETADEFGAFRFEALSPGPTSVMANLYGEDGSRWISKSHDLELTEGTNQHTIELFGSDGEAIEGSVLDAAGQPLGGVTVMVQRELEGPSIRVAFESWSLETDAGGRYRFELTPGLYRVQLENLEPGREPDPAAHSIVLEPGAVAADRDFVVE